MHASDGTPSNGRASAPNGSNGHSEPARATRREISRISLAHEGVVRLGVLSIDPALRRIARDDGREEIVEPRVMQVLVALIRAGGRILTRDELLMSCWRGVVVGEDALNRVIGRLRRIASGIGDGAFEVETITKVGYRLVSTNQRVALAASDAPPVTRKLSICVLPFANMSDDPQQAYFSDGISEDIITDLSKVSALFVAARTTAFAFRGKGIDVPRVARQLNVGHVLEGSVRKAGKRVRITAQLIDGATGGHVWAERYDRDLEDIFTLQDEISQAIVGALKLKLLPDEKKKAVEQRGTTSAEAYNLFLMARRYYASGRDGELRGLEPIVRLCRRATEIDPSYARAWALMATAQTALRFIHNKPGDGGLAAVERALSLDPNLAEAHAVKARHLWMQGRADEASAEVQLALALDPESWEANAEAGRLSYIQLRLDEAVRYFEKATALMDTPPGDPGILVSCYTALGDAEGARRAAQLALARAERAVAQDQSNGAAMGFGVSALAALGEAGRARDWIERALLIDPDNMTMRYNFACAASALLKETDTALEVLGPVFAYMSMSWLSYAKADPDLDPIRDDPRFLAMIAAAETRLAAAEIRRRRRRAPASSPNLRP